jgi:hypothetical protein
MFFKFQTFSKKKLIKKKKKRKRKERKKRSKRKKEKGSIYFDIYKYISHIHYPKRKEKKETTQTQKFSYNFFTIFAKDSQ